MNDKHPYRSAEEQSNKPTSIVFKDDLEAQVWAQFYATAGPLTSSYRTVSECTRWADDALREWRKRR